MRMSLNLEFYWEIMPCHMSEKSDRTKIFLNESGRNIISFVSYIFYSMSINVFH